MILLSMCISMKVVAGQAYFCGRQWNYICICTVKPYAILKIKSALVEICVLRHGVYHLQSSCVVDTLSWRPGDLYYNLPGISTPRQYWSIRKPGLHKTVSELPVYTINRFTDLLVVHRRLPPKVVLQVIFLKVYWSLLRLFHVNWLATELNDIWYGGQPTFVCQFRFLATLIHNKV